MKCTHWNHSCLSYYKHVSISGRWIFSDFCAHGHYWVRLSHLWDSNLWRTVKVFFANKQKGLIIQTQYFTVNYSTRTLTVKVCTSNNFTFVKYTVIKQSRRFDVFIIVDLPQMIKPVNWLFSFITVTIMWSYSWAFDFQGICSFMNKLFKKLSVCFMSNYNLYIVLRLQKHNIYF